MSVKTILTSTRGFVRSSAFLITTLALAAALPMAACAATPVAVWDGDFSVSQDGYTLQSNGNTLSADKSTITIDQTLGVKVDFGTTLSSGVTVLFKYSDLNLSLGSEQTMVTRLKTSGNDNRTGVYLMPSGQTSGVWNGATFNTNATYGTSATQGEVTSLQTSGVMAFTYNTTGASVPGTCLYRLVSGRRTQLYYYAALGTSDEGGSDGVAIGGNRGTTATNGGPATGMKITGIAVFSGALTEDEMTSYVWPSAKVDGVAKYANWANTSGMVTWMTDGNATSGTELAGANAKYALFDMNAGIDVTPTYTGNSGNPSFNGTSNEAFWHYLNNGSESGVYTAPGLALRFSGTDAYKTIGGTFGPVALGGICVESGATGYSFSQVGHERRSTILGDATAQTETYFKFEEPFTILRSGQMRFVGIINIELPESTDVLTLNKTGSDSDDTGNINYANNEAFAPKIVNTISNLPNTGAIHDDCETMGGTLKMHGEGTIEANKLTASGATLDFSDLDSRVNANPFINCPLVVDADTKLVFASGISYPYAYKVATAISGTNPAYKDANDNVFKGVVSLDAENGVVTVANPNGATEIEVNSEFTVVSGNSASITVNEGASLYVNANHAGGVSGAGTIVVGEGITLDLGTSRPTGELTFAENGTLAVRLQSELETIELAVDSQPTSIVLYDTNGVAVANPRTSYTAGTLTISQVSRIVAVGATAFDTSSNWVDSAMPGEGEDAIVEISADAQISVTGDYTLAALVLSGGGTVSFVGAGSITAESVILRDGASLSHGGQIIVQSIEIPAGSTLTLNGGDGSFTNRTAISGAGSVVTYGNVDMAALNTFTGGITAKSGTLTTSAYSVNPWCSGFGPFSKDWGCAALKTITVEDGACVDLANTINTADGIGYKLVIAGRGVEQNGVFSGAIKYTGTSAVGQVSRQLSNIVLTGDALVDIGAGWGLVHSSYGAAQLGLSGHTLTIRGSNKQNFPMQNVSATSAGAIILENSTLLFGNNNKGACNLADVTVIAKGGSKLDFDKDVTAIGSVVIAPSADASVVIDGYAHMTNVVPVVKTSYIDASALTSGDTITLMTTDAALTEGENVTIVAGSRYDVTISGNTVTATIAALTPFLHYDFNAANSIAADSQYNFGNLNPAFVSSKNGQAGKFVSGTTPHYNSNSSGKSPFYSGEMTVVTLLKPREANNTILWNLGNGWGTGMALIARDSSTVAVVEWTNGSANGSDVVSVTGIADLMNKWHLVTIVANANGTTLYVDKQSKMVDTVLPSAIDGKGQFGSIHGTAGKYTAVSDRGYYLDDWRVYDAALTAKEVKALRRELFPDPLFIRLR